jgi:PTH1 family peptidyl-tRNA hydrolase
MLLLVGLGNPGPRYAYNRHNVGFMALELIRKRYGFSAARSRFEGETSEGTVAGEKILALKPLTFMNDSGRAVGAAANFHKIAPGDVIVLHDEIDLAPGKVRVKRGGGHAGHNGLRSITQHIGAEFRRVRMGVGHPGKERVLGHVLNDFSTEEREWAGAMIGAVSDSLPLLIAGDDASFMSEVARRAPPPQAPAPQTETEE